MRRKVVAATLRGMAVGEGRRTQLLRGVLDLCLLAVMQEGPAYGYEMTKRLRARGLSIVGEGSIYPLLARLERARRGLFAQLVVVPLFADHRILTQVAGDEMAVVRVLPPFVLSDADVEEFGDALRETVVQAQRMPSSLTRFALTAAGVRS